MGIGRCRADGARSSRDGCRRRSCVRRALDYSAVSRSVPWSERISRARPRSVCRYRVASGHDQAARSRPRAAVAAIALREASTDPAFSRHGSSRRPPRRRSPSQSSFDVRELHRIVGAPAALVSRGSMLPVARHSFAADPLSCSARDHRSCGACAAGQTASCVRSSSRQRDARLGRASRPRRRRSPSVSIILASAPLAVDRRAGPAPPRRSRRRAPSPAASATRSRCPGS